MLYLSVQKATRLTSAMNDDVDPCEDFYEFACGTWIKKHVIPEDRSSLSQFGVLRDDVEVTEKSKKTLLYGLMKLKGC